jgi:hypothetical protein
VDMRDEMFDGALVMSDGPDVDPLEAAARYIELESGEGYEVRVRRV